MADQEEILKLEEAIEAKLIQELETVKSQPGDATARYYDTKRAEASLISHQLKMALRRGSTPEAIRKLKMALKMAQYVGD